MLSRGPAARLVSAMKRATVTVILSNAKDLACEWAKPLICCPGPSLTPRMTQYKSCYSVSGLA